MRWPHSLSFTLHRELCIERLKTYPFLVHLCADMTCSYMWFQMRGLYSRFLAQMTCCLCFRSYEVRVGLEDDSPETIVLPDTGSPEAHHLEESFLFNQAMKGKRIEWQNKQYWLASLRALKGKCTPSVIANLAVALQLPIAVCNTRLRQSCVFSHVGAKPLCMCCALELCCAKRLLLLVHRGTWAFAVNHRYHRVDMRALRLSLRQLVA